MYPTVTIGAWPQADYTYTVNAQSISFTNSSTGAATYNWSFGDGNASTVQNPVHTYSFGNTYNVCLSVLSSFGCWDTVCKTITVSGINDNDISGYVEVLPSVSSTGIFSLAISLPDVRTASLLVYDINGKQVLVTGRTDVQAGKFQANLSGQQNGLYLLRIETDLGTTTKKVFIFK